jgi:tight adherence protein B
MLKNEVYIGNLCQGRSKKVSHNSKKTRYLPREDWIICEGTHEPLIDKDTFELVQKRVTSRRNPPKTGFHSVFKEIAKCADCGRAMSPTASRKKDEPYKLSCGGYKQYGASMCSNHFISYNTLCEIVLCELKKWLSLTPEEKELIVREFRYMVHQLDMNLSIESILKAFAKRTEDDEVRTFVEVFSMAKRSGGNMRGIIRNAVCQIGEEIDVKREIDTIMAAKKLEFKVMSVIPFLMVCYIKVSFPEFVDVLYGNPLGISVMTVCLIIYVASYELGKRIVEVEV